MQAHDYQHLLLENHIFELKEIHVIFEKSYQKDPRESYQTRNELLMKASTTSKGEPWKSLGGGNTFSHFNK